jgi:hypothetical protein
MYGNMKMKGKGLTKSCLRGLPLVSFFIIHCHTRHCLHHFKETVQPKGMDTHMKWDGTSMAHDGKNFPISQ